MLGSSSALELCGGALEGPAVAGDGGEVAVEANVVLGALTSTPVNFASVLLRAGPMSTGKATLMMVLPCGPPAAPL